MPGLGVMVTTTSLPFATAVHERSAAACTRGVVVALVIEEAEDRSVEATEDTLVPTTMRLAALAAITNVSQFLRNPRRPPDSSPTLFSPSAGSAE
jgi:hypothetical protein